MARIENTSERQIDLSGDGKTVSIPRGHGGDDQKQNGVADVDDAILEALKNDPFTVHMFASGDLVKKGASEKPAAEKPAAFIPATTHGDDFRKHPK